MAGEVENPERVRFVANERLDHVDADHLSQQARAYADASSKAVLATPLASSAAPVGMLLAGGSITVNPTSGTDGLLRVDSTLLVGLDSDGRTLIKPEGTAITVAIPAGGASYQVYLYYLDDTTKAAKRRAIPATSPFTEFTITPYTRFQGAIGIYVKAGTLGTVVASDAVNGVTTALLFLGIASNSAGVVTYDGSATENRIGTVKPPTARPSSSSSSGSARTLHDVSQGTLYELARAKFTDQGGLSGSAASTTTGAATSHIRISGLSGMNAALVGQSLSLSGAASSGNNGVFRITGYINSTTVDVYNKNAVQPDANDGSIVWSVLAHDLPGGVDPPQQSTNYGAYSEVRRGLDSVDRASKDLVTVGDGVVSFGTFDQSDFASDDLLLKAAYNDVVARGGGTIVIKPGVVLDNFAADVTFDQGNGTEDVVLEGWRRGLLGPTSYSMIQLGGRKILTPTSGGLLVLRNLSVDADGTAFLVRGRFEAHDSSFGNVSNDGASVLTSGATSVEHLRFFNCYFEGSLDTADDTATSAVHVASGTLFNCEVVFDSCTFYNRSLQRTVTIDYDFEVRSGGRFVSCYFVFGYEHGSDLSADTAMIYLRNGNFGRGTTVTGCRFRGSLTDAGRANYTGVRMYDAGSVVVSSCVFDHVLSGVRVTGASNTAGNLVISSSHFVGASASNQSSCRGVHFDVAAINTIVDSCAFSSVGFTVGALQTSGYDVSGLVVRGCTFLNGTFAIVAHSVVFTLGGLIVEGNVFFASLSIYPGLQAPIISMSTTDGVSRATWRGNVHSGYSNDGSAATWLGLRMVAYEIDALIEGNAFRRANDNVVYTGSTADPDDGGPNRLIQLDAHVHRWTIANNVGELLGASSSGANFQQVTCIDAGVKLRGTVDAGSVLERCAITGNRFGDSNSRCSFLQVGSSTTGLQIGSLKIANNTHRTASSVTSTSVAAYGWNIWAEGTASVNDNLHVHGNDWFIDSPAGTLNVDWFVLRVAASGSATVEVVSVSDEVITVTGGEFASTKGWFFSSEITVRSLIFDRIVASVPGAATDPVMYTEFTNDGSYGVTYPSVPAATNWSTSLRVDNN